MIVRCDRIEARLELIRVVAGGYSSKHYHKNKDNLFYVVSGKLFVRIFKRVVGDGSIILDERRSCLYPFLVSWGIIHQFEAVTDVVAYEVYFGIKDHAASPTDIVRLSQNGIKEIA